MEATEVYYDKVVERILKALQGSEVGDMTVSEIEEEEYQPYGPSEIDEESIHETEEQS